MFAMEHKFDSLLRTASCTFSFFWTPPVCSEHLHMMLVPLSKKKNYACAFYLPSKMHLFVSHIICSSSTSSTKLFKKCILSIASFSFHSDQESFN